MFSKEELSELLTSLLSGLWYPSEFSWLKYSSRRASTAVILSDAWNCSIFLQEKRNRLRPHSCSTELNNCYRRCSKAVD